jgi:SAM-dependent methyltransferase
MYADLASWWPLLSGPEEYDEEASLYAGTISSLARRPVREVLELGSGGGNNASHLKAKWAMTLTDLSEDMLAVSRALNPELEHLAGDMRSIRLDRDFDAVLVHDAVMYMTSEQDLAATVATAAAHLRRGGAVLFVPDHTQESYVPDTSWGGNDGEGRSLRYLEWNRPRKPGATFAEVSFVIVLKEGGAPPRVVHDEHEFGLFPRATWLRLIEEAGLEAVALPYEHSTFGPSEGREMFAGIRAEA